MLDENDHDESDVFDEDIESAVLRFEQTHDGMILFEAMRRCVQYGKPFPDRVWSPFMAALESYKNAEARTLDEAFGVRRPKGWSQSAARARARKNKIGMSTAAAVYLSVVHRHLQGRPIAQELFDEVGDKHAISGSTARNYYREVKESMEGQEF